MDEKKSSSAAKRKRLYEEPVVSDDRVNESGSKAAPRKSSSRKASSRVKTSTTKKRGKQTSVPKEAQDRVSESSTYEDDRAEKYESASDDQEILGKQRVEQVNKLINKYVKWSAGLVIIPIPVFDLASLITSQTSMIAEIAAMYDIPFSKEMKKSLISVLTTSLFSHSVAYLPWLSVSKIIPGFGLLLNTISYPIAAGATTYAVGKVFMLHFESGGTLLDFDPKKMKDYFRSTYHDGIKRAKAL